MAARTGQRLSSDQTPGGAAPPRWLRYLPWAAVLLLVLLVAAGLRMRTHRPDEPPFLHFRLATVGPPVHAVISPDGKRVMYQTGPPEGASILVQDLDGDAPREILPAGPWALAFWSPDGTAAGFFAEKELRQAPVSGGAAVTVTKLPGEPACGAAWSGDGRSIIFSAGRPARIYTVPAEGGGYKLLVQPGGGEALQDFVDPHIPAGSQRRILLFAIGGASLPYRLVALDLEDGKRRDLGPGRRPAWSPTGHLVFEDREGLWALPFSLAGLEATGPAFPIQAGAARPSLSRDGTLAFVGGQGSTADHPGPAAGSPAPALHVVQDWFTGLH